MAAEGSNKTLPLIANITHQAINPLNGVIGTLDNVIDGTISEHRQMQRLRSARAQLEYTVSLIRNLAFFAQYGGDEPTPPKGGASKTTVVPQNLIEAAMFFQEQAANEGIKIDVVDAHRQTAVKGDPELLRQVFMNIIDNFIKYGSAASTVELRHWVQKKTGDVLIDIEGPSIPFDSNEDIFALGVRGEAAVAKTSAGSGLGLHICRLILEKVFAGSIEAEYLHAKGAAKFVIRIPGGFTTRRSSR